jgi:hypothetical protein
MEAMGSTASEFFSNRTSPEDLVLHHHGGGLQQQVIAVLRLGLGGFLRRHALALGRSLLGGRGFGRRDGIQPAQGQGQAQREQCGELEFHAISLTVSSYRV